MFWLFIMNQYFIYKPLWNKKYPAYIFIVFTLIASSYGQNNATHRKFPNNFLFGAATSSYQVEGSWNNSDKGENIWDRLTHTRNLVSDHSSGDIACDSYNKFTEDVAILKELGVNYYRFSISWSRILPTGFTNKISSDGIAYYNKLIDLLITNGITPVVTLYHWDLPQPLQDIGGWPNSMMEMFMADYARVVFENFGDRVMDWLTFNEPIEVCQAGYGDIEKAPALNYTGIAEYLCAHTLLKAHARIYHLYDDEFKKIQKGRIGLTISTSWHEPENSSSADDVEASETALQFSAGWFAHPIFSKEGDYPSIMKERIARLSKEQGFSSSRLPSFTSEEIEYIKGTFDFYGLNHYTTDLCRHTDETTKFTSPSYEEDKGVFVYQPDDWISAASVWLKVVPWGFKKLLVWIKNEYNDPEIIIFENGYSDLGDLDDRDRIDYYQKYLNAMLDAMEEGVTVSAFTVWSLMDNFEWLAGYTEKFGLYQVDFNNPSRPRTAKSSAKYLKEIIETKIISRVY